MSEKAKGNLRIINWTRHRRRHSPPQTVLITIPLKALVQRTVCVMTVTESSTQTRDRMQMCKRSLSTAASKISVTWQQSGGTASSDTWQTETTEQFNESRKATDMK